MSSEATDRGTVPPPKQQPSAPPPDESQLEVTFWQEVMDPNTNHVYYWNPETNEVTWTLPANGVISNEMASGNETGTGQSGLENETSTANTETKSTAEVAKGLTNSSTKQDPVKKPATLESKSDVKIEAKTSKKGAKISEVDIFEDTTNESKFSKVTISATNAVSQPSKVSDVKDTPTASDAKERNLHVLTKKRKASPEPLDGDVGDKEPSVEEHQITKKQRMVTVPGGGLSGPREKIGVGNVVETSGGVGGSVPATATSNKQAEQMLRVSYM